ncbi:SPOR domain-containing protein [Pseudobacteriovorax antillogorgiicola]|uniref:Sporulation related domain-containing protein n=1 Tax=Pseudobacteriovorax antillogorgiicola TaxID=1513793 RepID=A0A1Y6CNA5_9BACT|nr:SPOR domain-containing protein [Pseudobacteriovorax antillogorgiicola]TCS44380.1 sporulation related protein [Pseudobacteriovorax antillogorgiicola]SMF79407.1 Sporulation related domain-containing protein [Pseudobacteriovorax antillogorgiicola]
MPTIVQRLLLSFVLLSTLGASFFFSMSYFIDEATSHGTLSLAPPPQVHEPLFYFEIGTTPDSDLPAALPATPQYTVELSSSQNEKEAQRLVKKLSMEGVEAFYTPLNQRGHVVYRVRSGIYNSREQALKQASFLAREYRIKGQVERL